MKYLIKLPLEISTRSKLFKINLNNYRNECWQVLHQAKKNYGISIYPQIFKLPVFDKIKLTYTYHPKNDKRLDLGNIMSISDKFFSDALVSYGKIIDDSFKYIPEIKFKVGEKRKIPEIIVEIEEIN